MGIGGGGEHDKEVPEQASLRDLLAWTCGDRTRYDWLDHHAHQFSPRSAWRDPDRTLHPPSQARGHAYGDSPSGRSNLRLSSPTTRGTEPRRSDGRTHQVILRSGASALLLSRGTS